MLRAHQGPSVDGRKNRFGRKAFFLRPVDPPLWLWPDSPDEGRNVRRKPRDQNHRGCARSKSRPQKSSRIQIRGEKAASSNSLLSAQAAYRPEPRERGAGFHPWLPLVRRSENWAVIVRRSFVALRLSLGLLRPACTFGFRRRVNTRRFVREIIRVFQAEKIFYQGFAAMRWNDCESSWMLFAWRQRFLDRFSRVLPDRFTRFEQKRIRRHIGARRGQLSFIKMFVMPSATFVTCLTRTHIS